MKCQFNKDCKMSVLKMIGECKHCKKSFCSSHRLPELHDCTHFDDYKRKLKKILEEKLNEESTAKKRKYNI
jgi:predicted nucleic acid binding AN1-type Zn finger protein